MNPPAARTAPAVAEHHPEARRPNVLATIGFVAIGALLAVIMPLWLVAEVADVGRSAAWPLTWALIFWAGVRITLDIAIGRARLFDFFFWLFVYIFMGIAPTVQMRSGQVASTTPGMDPALDLPAAVIVWVGVICYEVGFAVAMLRERRVRRDAPARSRPAAGISVMDVNPTRTYLLLAAGLVATAYFVVGIGPDALFGSRDAAFAARSAKWADPSMRSIVYDAAIYPILVGLGALSQLRRRERKGWQLWMQLGAAAVVLIVVNPISSARYSFGTVAFAIAVFAGALATSYRVRTTLIAAILGLLFVFPIADAFRRVSGANFTRDGFFGEYRGAGDYDAFWQIANSLSYLSDGLVSIGQQAAGVLFFWVPRSVWSGKPTDTGALLASYRGYSYDNLSAPFWAEFIMNGGIPVLVAGFLIVGYAWRRLDSRIAPALSRYGVWAIAGAIFPVFTTILLRGSLLQAADVVAITVVCLLWVTEWKSRPTGSPEPPYTRSRAPVRSRP